MLLCSKHDSGFLMKKTNRSSEDDNFYLFPELNPVSEGDRSLHTLHVFFHVVLFSFDILRCFSAWKETVEQKALYRCNLVRLRAVSLRKYFQQWVQMLQDREGNKQAMVNFFLLQWRQHCGEQLGVSAESEIWRCLGSFLLFLYGEQQLKTVR